MKFRGATALALMSLAAGDVNAARRPAPTAAPPPASHEAALLAAGGGDLQRQIYLARERVLPALVNVQPVVRDYSSEIGRAHV